MTQPRCAWPGCEEQATDALRLYPGMRLTIRGEEFTQAELRVCPTHAPDVGRLVQEALDAAQGRGRGRGHLAPGDVEWEEYIGDDR